MDTETAKLQQDDGVAAEMKGKFLSFYIDGELYCIDLPYISEIKQILPFATVPDLPDYVKGVLNLRDEIMVPIIDMRLRFHKFERDYDERTCIIVISVSNILLGLVVDSVSEVVTFEEKNIIPPPSAKSGFSNKFIKALGKADGKIYLIVDSMKLFSDDEFAAFGDMV